MFVSIQSSRQTGTEINLLTTTDLYSVFYWWCPRISVISGWNTFCCDWKCPNHCAITCLWSFFWFGMCVSSSSFIIFKGLHGLISLCTLWSVWKKGAEQWSGLCSALFNFVKHGIPLSILVLRDEPSWCFTHSGPIDVSLFTLWYSMLSSF